MYLNVLEKCLALDNMLFFSKAFMNLYSKLARRDSPNALTKDFVCQLAHSEFAKKHVWFVDKYGCSVRRHIADGVCLPAMDPFQSRHVSRRSI